MFRNTGRFFAVGPPRRGGLQAALGVAVAASIVAVPAFATGPGVDRAARAAKPGRPRAYDRAEDVALIKKEAGKLRGPKGASGRAGRDGVAGAPGAQGPPGPTVSAAASNTPGTVTLTSSNLGVLSLGGVGGTGVIRPLFSGRLLVNASAEFRKTDAAGISTVDCDLVMLTNGAKPASGLPGEVVISQGVDRGFTTQFEVESLAVVGWASVLAGNSYDIELVCQSFSPSVDYARGTMTALVAAG